MHPGSNLFLPTLKTFENVFGKMPDFLDPKKNKHNVCKDGLQIIIDVYMIMMWW